MSRHRSIRQRLLTDQILLILLRLAGAGLVSPRQMKRLARQLG